MNILVFKDEFVDLRGVYGPHFAKRYYISYASYTPEIFVFEKYCVNTQVVREKIAIVLCFGLDNHSPFK